MAARSMMARRGMRSSPISLVLAGGRLAAPPCKGEPVTGGLRAMGHAIKRIDRPRMPREERENMKRLLAACASVAALASAPPAHAQEFPSKLIRIVVPFTPGGSNDVVAR